MADTLHHAVHDPERECCICVNNPCHAVGPNQAMAHERWRIRRDIAVAAPADDPLSTDPIYLAVVEAFCLCHDLAGSSAHES